MITFTCQKFIKFVLTILAMLPFIVVFRPAPAFGMTPAVTTFQALGDNQTFIPPDTMGAVGPNHVVTILNTEVRIQDRAGRIISTTDIDAWPVFSPYTNNFDPHVLYDPYGGRWIVSAGANPDSASAAILVAVSKTSDPTGPWNPLLAIKADPKGNSYADYPGLGFNRNWVVVTANIYSNNSENFQTARVIAINKAKLYDTTGAIPVTYKSWDDPNGFSYVPATTYDQTINTIYLAQTNAINSTSDNGLQISTITGPVGSEIFSTVQNPAADKVATVTSVWDYASSSGNDFAPQPGFPSHNIDAGDDRLLSCQYRNFSLWCAQTVYLPAGGAPNRTAAQWWQVNPATGVVQQFGRVDDPSGVNFYAYPTMAVNKNNDALLGYTRFSKYQYPSANYSFRFGTDTPNTMGADTVFKTGDAAYYKTKGGTSNRWGDYSSTVVDPADDTTLWTIQEYAAAHSGSNSSWGTWWARFAPQGLPVVISTVPAAGATHVSTGTTISAGFNEGMDLSTFTGSTFTLTGGGSTVTGTFSYNQGTFTATLAPSAALAPGTFYTATITTGIKDLVGNSPAQSFSWSFTTASTPPAVIATVPAAGARGIGLAATVSAIFNEAINPATMTGVTFTLTKGGTPVAGSVNYDPGAFTALFAPSSLLDANTTFSATVTTGVKSPDGTPMTEPAVWSFTTLCYVSMGGTCYPSLAQAYAAAQNGSVIKAMAGLSVLEALTLANGITVTISGGYDTTLTNVVDATIIGPLVLVNGSVVVSNLLIQ